MADETASPAAPEATPPEEAGGENDGTLEEKIVAALRTVFDPEIPVNIYELGLIYNLEIGAGNHVTITMTLTSPACPVAGILPGEVQARVEEVPGVRSAEVELVWDPTWNPSMMSDVARLELGMM